MENVWLCQQIINKCEYGNECKFNVHKLCQNNSPIEHKSDWIVLRKIDLLFFLFWYTSDPALKQHVTKLNYNWLLYTSVRQLCQAIPSQLKLEKALNLHCS